MKHWRGLAVLAASPALLMAGVGSAHMAGAATQTPLYSQFTRNSCPGGGEVHAVHGFAVLSDAQPSEGLTVEVSLQGAVANDTYTVHVIQCNGGHDLGPSTVGTFVTDGNGDGTFFGDHVEKAAADHAFVGVIDESHNSIYATAAVPI
jgi:hypothetical protein